LQDCVSPACGHACPPWAAITSTGRVRACEPEPQLSEHCCHEPHWPTVQSTGHGAVEQACSWLVALHDVPPHMLVTAVLRVRIWLPPPQVYEQVLHVPHGVCEQWTGQHVSLQPAVLASVGHATPPCAASVVTVRARTLVPPPQVTVHEPHSAQSDTTQSTGHGELWHDCVSVSCGHCWPPCSAGVVIERERLFVPPPHVLVHAVNADQADVVQCTGQAGTPVHACTSLW